MSSLSQRLHSVFQFGLMVTLPLAAVTTNSASAAPSTFEEKFDGGLARQWTGSPANPPSQGSLALKESTRLTSIPKFQYGRYEVQLKMSGMGKGNYAYFGFMSRDPWAFDTCWAMLDDENRLSLQVRRGGGEVIQPGASPVVTPDVWHTLALDWTPTAVRMEWDGEVVVWMNQEKSIPSAYIPALVDVVTSGTSGFTVETRNIKVEGGDMRVPKKREIGILPPARRPIDTRLVAAPKPIAPNVAVAGDSITAQNAFYQSQISWKDGLHLEKLYNNVTKASCLAGDDVSQLFSIVEGDTKLRSSDFTVTQKRQSKQGNALTVELVAENASSGWEVRLTQTVDSSPEIKLNLELTNKSERGRKAMVLWPHITGLQIGAKPQDNYYVFPYKGGWSSNHSMELGSMYGQQSGFLQLFTLFNPSIGSSVYLYLKDESGRAKQVLMRKLDDSAEREDLERYVAISPDNLPPSGTLTESSATQFAMGHAAMNFAPRQSRELPQLVLAVAPGDWHQSFRSYSNWAHSWMKKTVVPEWYKSEFQMSAVHDIGGNMGYETGFLKDGKWGLGKKAKSGDGILETVFWWQHVLDKDGKPLDEATVRSQSWRRLDIGDYDYWKELGGLEALRREIVECHRKGVRVSLYTTPRFAWEGSRVYKAHPEWALLNIDGSHSNDWSATVGGVTMRQYDLCYSIPEWRKHISETATRIVKDTGCDGIFMDTMNEAKPCYNPAHKHPETSSLMAKPMLEAYRNAIKKANPQAYMSSEDLCEEQFAQYVDGTLIKTFAASEVPMAPQYDLYALHFARFYFPEIKYFEWGSTFDDGARRAFFNGVGYMRGELHGGTDPLTKEKMTTEGNIKYLSDMTRIMSENSDAFASPNPEPYVRTLVSGVYANKFPGQKQTVWTIYNRSGHNINADVIQVPNVAGATYVELLHNTQLKPIVRNGQTFVKMSVKNGEVLALAQRQPGFIAKATGSKGVARQTGRPSSQN